MFGYNAPHPGVTLDLLEAMNLERKPDADVSGYDV
jgi:hypothetical protein